MAVGSENGGLSIIQISESLSNVSRNDRTSLTSVSSFQNLKQTQCSQKSLPFSTAKLLERECRREKTLESRSKDNKANKDRLHRSSVAAVQSSTNNEDNKTGAFLFEPPADGQADASAPPCLPTDVADDQLQVAEELFFDVIQQVAVHYMSGLIYPCLSDCFLLSAGHSQS